MTKAHPILFSAPMVRALLDGRKTQTRRIVKIPDRLDAAAAWRDAGLGAGDYLKAPNRATDDLAHGEVVERVRCPYGDIGDLLWVRETCRADELTDGNDGVRYAADDSWQSIANTEAAAEAWVELNHYRGKRGLPVPGIHMPRWASRLTIELTDVRVERLQSITETDAKAEGAATLAMDDEGRFYESDAGTHRTGFAGLWQHINGERDGAGWDVNPWVWALTFRVHKANVDTVLAGSKKTEAA